MKTQQLLLLRPELRSKGFASAVLEEPAISRLG